MKQCLSRGHSCAAVWLVLAIGAVEAPRAGADPKPNIVLIVGDDMGYADIGVQGARDIRTPHLDALARAGVRFSSGYVSGSYCRPTRAAMMTGRYQQRYGHEFNSGPPASASDTFGLPLSEKTLADRLRGAGYRTGIGEDLAAAHLFNLASDVGERVDLAQKEPDRAKALESMWKKWNATLEEPRWLPGQRRQ